MKCLNLGCGKLHLKDFINIDWSEASNPDLRWDCHNELPFDEGSIDLIYTSHFIEHFEWKTVPNVLRDWCRVLRKGGVIEIWCPDLDIIHGWTKIEPVNMITYANVNKFVFNQEMYPGAKHCACFNFDLMKVLLEDAGFEHVERLNYATDYSFKPQHESTSMGVKAVKK